MSKARKRESKLIRISKNVLTLLDSKRGSGSYDLILRRLLGLPGKKGESAIKEYYLLLGANKIFSEAADARGQALVRAVKLKQEKPERLVRVREVV